MPWHKHLAGQRKQKLHQVVGFLEATRRVNKAGTGQTSRDSLVDQGYACYVSKAMANGSNEHG